MDNTLLIILFILIGVDCGGFALIIAYICGSYKVKKEKFVINKTKQLIENDETAMGHKPIRVDSKFIKKEKGVKYYAIYYLYNIYEKENELFCKYNTYLLAYDTKLSIFSYKIIEK